MTGKILTASAFALAVAATTAGTANAGSRYDGRWSLSIVTTRGACSTYNFPVDIANGQVSFPGLVKARGHVSPNGGVSVYVAAGDKSAQGSGRLTVGSGSGRWSGHSGTDRCSGTWTVQRT
jgi:hypothetical protein